MSDTIQAVFFSNQLEFREWLSKNHKIETELIVGFYKVSSGKPSLTWSESVDQALCFGWIDGIRRTINVESYCIRFTPRRPTSIWSTININKIEVLTKQGLMLPKGIEAFEKRKNEKTSIYSFENEKKDLPESFEKEFEANLKAWNFFKTRAPSYQKTLIHWILDAKQEKTRLNRLAKAIIESEKQNRLF